MSRYYDEPIQVVYDRHDTPVSFIWRDRAYQVLAVLAHWHLCDRWWITSAETTKATEVTKAEGGAGAGVAAAARSPARHRAATDRFYWRLQCASPSTSMVFCVVYHDAAAAVGAGRWSWYLERVYD